MGGPKLALVVVEVVTSSSPSGGNPSGPWQIQPLADPTTGAGTQQRHLLLLAVPMALVAIVRRATCARQVVHCIATALQRNASLGMAGWLALFQNQHRPCPATVVVFFFSSVPGMQYDAVVHCRAVPRNETGACECGAADTTIALRILTCPHAV